MSFLSFLLLLTKIYVTKSDEILHYLNLIKQKQSEHCHHQILFTQIQLWVYFWHD